MEQLGYKNILRGAIRLSVQSRTKDDFLEILFWDKNQVDDKIACELGEGF